MAPIYEKYSGDLDVAAIYVGALMNLNPWQLWNKDTKTGKITPVDDNTLLCVKISKKHLRTWRVPKNILHYAICIVMPGLLPFPEGALPAADVLQDLMPDYGHLVHMPSHIDAWVGQWKEAIDCNIAAVEADDRYVNKSGNESQFYKFYRMHNHPILLFGALYVRQPI